MKALLLAGGELLVDAEMRALAGAAELVIAADGGLRHARALGVSPDLIVGDFDSAGAGDLAHFASVPREHHPQSKEQLDLELALDAAWQRGATQAAVLGAFGGRLDQSLAALLIAARLRSEGRLLTLHGGGADVYLPVAGEALALEAAGGTVFSLLSLAGDAEVDVAGARYELRRAALPYGVGLGVSNVVTDGASLRVHRGMVALVVERSGSATGAREQIWGDKAERIAVGLAELDPDLADLVTGVAYDRVFERPGLDLKTKELLALANLIALGADDELETHVWGALNCGASPRELRETVIHAAMFCGFPRALAAMRVVKRVLDKHGARQDRTT